VPTQLRRLLDADGPGLEALRSFDAVLVGGAALEDGLRERADAAGVAVTTTYGMSETAGGCVYDGVPLDGVTVDLLATGRIVLGGPTLASGYVDDPDATAAAFVDGRFRTNDLGTWDGQRLVVLGRADDVIVTGGENVAPAAVERALLAEPGVAAACVVGIPDVEWGQLVSAAIVADGARPSDDRLRAAVRTALGRAAVPRVIVEVAELPLRGIGKPDRVAVAALVARART
jgi:O-succinylbenzoic acid--CoA ligase